MFSLRWEVTPLETPYSAPRGDVLWPPIASGTIEREDIINRETREQAPVTSLETGIYGPSEVITIPSTVDGWSSLVLVLESLGTYDWIIAFAPRGQTPQAPPCELCGTDAIPSIVVPASRVFDSGIRCREIRSVRPGWSFIARPRLYRKQAQG